ncbi:MAG: GNAT family N-acetyltransferase [Deltaproteobacteria bacterium]|nr:GNAT family N-acetyltransferase [Deltaproteobacteria bacterium]
MSLSIRPATVRDAALLVELVRQLAVYEKAPDAVRATPEDFARYGFGTPSFFEALIAEWSGQPVGFALYFFTFSTWTGKPSLYLEDLFVQPEARGRGIGKSLFLRVASEAVARGCERYQWQVLDWNSPAISFYEAMGALPTREWVPYRVEGEALRALAREPNGSASNLREA